MNRKFTAHTEFGHLFSNGQQLASKPFVNVPWKLTKTANTKCNFITYCQYGQESSQCMSIEECAHSAHISNVSHWGPHGIAFNCSILTIWFSIFWVTNKKKYGKKCRRRKNAHMFISVSWAVSSKRTVGPQLIKKVGWKKCELIFLFDPNPIRYWHRCNKLIR